jgi:hypothetical protein
MKIFFNSGRQNSGTLICLLASAAACANVLAVAPSASPSRYRVIAKRNLFGLTPVEQPKTNLQPPALPKITLTGITTIFNDKRALLKILPPAGAPGEREQSLILAEGQRIGALEVLAIDEIRGTVKANYSGIEITLTFDQDGARFRFHKD